MTRLYPACNQAPFIILYLSGTTFLNYFQKSKRNLVLRSGGQLRPWPLKADYNTKHCVEKEWLGPQIGLRVVTETSDWKWTPGNSKKLDIK